MHSRQDEITSICNGEDITSHYLNMDQKDFRIFRKKNQVFAVQYKNDEPIDAVYMWESNKNEKKLTMEKEFQKIGKGIEGEVYEKTKDKAFKKILVDPFSTSEPFSKEEAKLINVTLLQQKFMLKNNDIEKNFNIGLWNIKGDPKQEPKYIMPKLDGVPFSPHSSNYSYGQVEEDFILAVRKLNKLGYYHFDYARMEKHQSNNAIKTKDKIVLIDMDRGLSEINTNPVTKEDYRWAQCAKDEWLSICNYGNEKYFLWHKNNPTKSLSDFPETLYDLAKKGEIFIPKKLYLSYDNDNKKFTLDMSNEDFLQDTINKILDSLKSYTKKNIFSRFFSGAWDRNNLNNASLLIKNIQNQIANHERSSVEILQLLNNDLVKYLQSEAMDDNNRPINKNGEFYKLCQKNNQLINSTLKLFRLDTNNDEIQQRNNLTMKKSSI